MQGWKWKRRHLRQAMHRQMKRHHSHLLSALKQAQKEQAAQQPVSTETPEERAALIEEAMKSMDPASPFYGVVKEASE